MRRTLLGCLLASTLCMDGCARKKTESRPQQAHGFTQQDKIEATRTIVAWVVEQKQIPGVEPYADAEIMKLSKRIYVVCDFLPTSVSVSDDSRVQRVTREEQKALFESQGYGGVDYLQIALNPNPDTDELHFLGSNDFGRLGGHAFEFTLQKTDEKLKASGRIILTN